MNDRQYRCQVCQVIIQKTNRSAHENGKKHMRNMLRAGFAAPSHAEMKDETTETSKDNGPAVLIVKGYPPYTRLCELQNYLCEFGPFMVTDFKVPYAIVKCNDKKSADMLIYEQSKLFVYGTQITISHYTPELVKQASDTAQSKGPKVKGRQFVMSRNKEMIIEPNELDLSGGFDQQCGAILSSIRLTREEVESVSLLYSNLTELFQYLWPGCIAVPFGSITTGLGIKTSDADCFIELPNQFRDANGNHVQKARNVMRRFPHIFSEILTIPRANTPIVKFFHVPTRMNCDVSFKSPLGTRNSKLIAFILRTDPRILNLCILIKYWAKIHELTGTGKMSNYALTLLVIFYLQQQPDPLVHSIKTLQGRESYFVDGWNTGFVENHNLIPPLRNDSHLKYLLGGFFKYYAQFNYKELVVCPYLGMPLPKKCFENVKNLSDDFYLYKKNTIPLKTNSEIVIQDPFEQCRNVSSCVGFNLFHKTIQTIEWAANIYEQDLKNGTDNFLRNILVQKPILKPVISHMNLKVMINPFVLKNLPEDTWMKLVSGAFMLIFRDILHFSVSTLNTENDSPANIKKSREKYLCKASKLVWQRKNVDDANPEFLKKQMAITNKIITENKARPVSMHVIADLVFLKKECKSHIILKRENDEDSHFEEFGKFCLRDVGMWFQKLLLRHATKDIKENELLGTIASTSSVKGGNSKVISETKEKMAENVVATIESVAEEMEQCSDDSKIRSKTASKSKDIPKGKKEFNDSTNSSPTDPPAKIQKKD